MTREEAKEFLIDVSYKLGNMAVEYLTEKDGEKMLEAIKALEQEPSGDLISRQAVMDCIDGYSQMIIRPLKLKDYIDELTPVNPQEPKTGHWITEDMFDGDVAYRCSECNELFWIESGTPKDNEYNFCPKCGAKMVESEE